MPAFMQACMHHAKETDGDGRIRTEPHGAKRSRTEPNGAARSHTESHGDAGRRTDTHEDARICTRAGKLRTHIVKYRLACAAISRDIGCVAHHLRIVSLVLFALNIVWYRLRTPRRGSTAIVIGAGSRDRLQSLSAGPRG